KSKDWSDADVIVRSLAFKFEPAAKAVVPAVSLPEQFGFLFFVEKDAGGKLQVESMSGVRGLLDKADAVLLTDAGKDFSDRIAKDPKAAGAHYLRGMALSETGKKDEAKKDLDQAIKLNPKLAPAWYHRSNLRPAGEREQAFEDLGEAIKLEPKNVALRLDRYN